MQDAATVIAVRAVPGDKMVEELGPEFPAAIVNTTPAVVALSTARLIASSGFPEPPRLMLETSTRSVVSPSPFGSTV